MTYFGVFVRLHSYIEASTYRILFQLLSSPVSCMLFVTWGYLVCFLGKRKYIYKVGSNLKYKKWTTKGSVDKVSNTKRTFIGSLIYRLCKGYRSCGASSRKCFTHKHKHILKHTYTHKNKELHIHTHIIPSQQKSLHTCTFTRMCSCALIPKKEA